MRYVFILLLLVSACVPFKETNSLLIPPIATDVLKSD
jgi:hypothetical protein